MKKRNFLDYTGMVGMLLALVLIYSPIIIVFILSFTPTYSLSELGSGFTLKWYRSLFVHDFSRLKDDLDIAIKYISNIQTLHTAIGSTFLVTIISTIVSTIAGTFFAIAIHSFSKRLRTVFMTLNNMSVVNPDIVTGFLLLLVFVLFQTLFGLQRGFVTVLISHIFFSIPYVVLSVLPRLNQIDPNMYEAARDLGCTRFKAIITVLIPAISTGIISGMMFAFTMSIDDFVITMFVSGTEFMNVSTWIDSSMRRGFIPKTVYAYNVIVFMIASLYVVFSNLKSTKKSGVK